MAEDKKPIKNLSEHELRKLCTPLHKYIPDAVLFRSIELGCYDLVNNIVEEKGSYFLQQPVRIDGLYLSNHTVFEECFHYDRNFFQKTFKKNPRVFIECIQGLLNKNSDLLTHIQWSDIANTLNKEDSKLLISNAIVCSFTRQSKLNTEQLFALNKGTFEPDHGFLKFIEKNNALQYFYSHKSFHFSSYDVYKKINKMPSELFQKVDASFFLQMGNAHVLKLLNEHMELNGTLDFLTIDPAMTNWPKLLKNTEGLRLSPKEWQDTLDLLFECANIHAKDSKTKQNVLAFLLYHREIPQHIKKEFALKAYEKEPSLLNSKFIATTGKKTFYEHSIEARDLTIYEYLQALSSKKHIEKQLKKSGISKEVATETPAPVRKRRM